MDDEAYAQAHALITGAITAPDWLREQLRESIQDHRTKLKLALCRELPANQADLFINLALDQLQHCLDETDADGGQAPCARCGAIAQEDLEKPCRWR